jgi:hypothetical protein
MNLLGDCILAILLVDWPVMALRRQRHEIHMIEDMMTPVRECGEAGIWDGMYGYVWD